jgi:hypothetical protein
LHGLASGCHDPYCTGLPAAVMIHLSYRQVRRHRGRRLAAQAFRRVSGSPGRLALWRVGSSAGTSQRLEGGCHDPFGLYWLADIGVTAGQICGGHMGLPWAVTTLGRVNPGTSHPTSYPGVPMSRLCRYIRLAVLGWRLIFLTRSTATVPVWKPASRQSSRPIAATIPVRHQLEPVSAPPGRIPARHGGGTDCDAAKRQ